MIFAFVCVAVSIGCGIVYLGGMERIKEWKIVEVQTKQGPLPSAQLLYFPHVNIEARLGKPTRITAGITNMGKPTDYNLRFTCISSIGDGCHADQSWFSAETDAFIGSGESKAFSIIVTPLHTGRYMMTVESVRADTNKTEMTKEFFLNVR